MGNQASDLSLSDYLRVTSLLAPEVAEKIKSEVAAYYSETTEEFVRRRHRELRAKGQANAAIYPQVKEELREYRVVPPDLSERQIRRIVYG